MAPHPADLANSGHGHASQGRRDLHCQLPEEEVDLIVVGVLALRDPEDFDELGLWPQQEAWGQLGHGPIPYPRPTAVSPSSLAHGSQRGPIWSPASKTKLDGALRGRSQGTRARE